MLRRPVSSRVAHQASPAIIHAARRATPADGEQMVSTHIEHWSWWALVRSTRPWKPGPSRLMDSINDLLMRMEIPGCYTGIASLMFLRLGFDHECDREYCVLTHEQAPPGQQPGAQSAADPGDAQQRSPVRLPRPPDCRAHRRRRRLHRRRVRKCANRRKRAGPGLTLDPKRTNGRSKARDEGQRREGATLRHSNRAPSSVPALHREELR